MTHSHHDAQPPHHSHHAHGLQHGHAHTDRPGHGPAPESDTGMAELLDLDATLGATVLAGALDAAAAAALGRAPRSIVDLGAGTGTGTLALAARFPGAQVHSLDATATMLERLDAAATAAGVADRVTTHLVDLDGDWPAELPGPVDLAWAALSLHHVSDPGQVLRQAYGALNPGGVLVVTEMAGAAVWAPADLGSGVDGLGERLNAALATHGYPVTAEWTTALGEACFAPVERREASFEASATTTDGARYMALHLSKNRDRTADDLSPEDLAALDVTIAGLEAGTSELRSTSARIVWVAVRPAGGTATTATTATTGSATAAPTTAFPTTQDGDAR